MQATPLLFGGAYVPVSPSAAAFAQNAQQSKLKGKRIPHCQSCPNSDARDCQATFKPHWHSSNPSSQRAIVSLLTALASPESTVRPSPQQRFESELQYSQSPHDIAAVFRWKARYLQLDGGSFAMSTKTSRDDQWACHRKITNSERTASHPQDAFSTILVPILPESHIEPLCLVLDSTSAVVANADANAISGSKPSKCWVGGLLVQEQYGPIQEPGPPSMPNGSLHLESSPLSMIWETS